MAESAQIAKVSYTHEAIADWLISNPRAHMRDCAKEFGYTQSWLSTVVNSDAFQVYFTQRRAALNHVIHSGISDQLQSTTRKALTILEAQLDSNDELDPGFVLDVADRLLHRQGYAPGKVSVLTQNTTVNLPPSGAVDMGTLSRARAIMQNIQISTGHGGDTIEVMEDGEVEMLLTLKGEDKA